MRRFPAFICKKRTQCTALGAFFLAKAAGKCADLFLVDSRRLELVGGEYSPADVLATVGLRGPVDCTVVQGRIVVRDGRLVTVDEAAVAEEARRCCRAYLEKK